MVESARVPVIEGIVGLELVGEGGFAVVYRGHQRAFRRDVAVKVIRRSGLDADDRRRFERECQAMGALSGHPGIVTLFDAGFTSEERPYLVMAYAPDGTLHDLVVARGALSWPDVTELGVRLAGALETAHRAGVLHRDIKPANVLRSEYGGQLSDFGIARIQGGHETRSGVITASVAHAAPEILDGEVPTARADVYALASTLFEALDGRAAFVRDTDEGLLPLIRRVVSEPPPDLRVRGVPDEVARVVEAGMEKDPGRRYASAEAFGLALQRGQRGLGVSVSDMVVVGDPLPGTTGGTDATPAAGATVARPSQQGATGGSPPATPTMVPAAGAAATGAAPTTVDPAPPRHPSEEYPKSGGTRKAAVIALFLALVVVLAAGAFVLTQSNDDDTGGEGTVVGAEAPTTAVATAVPDSTVTTEVAATATIATIATTTMAAPTTTLSPDQAAFAELQALLIADQPTVDSLAEQWVPQLSAKREGLEIDGVVFGFEEILADHNARRLATGAVLADGANYNFEIDDAPMIGWYITLVPIGFATSDGALGWCLDAGIDRENCFARLISNFVFEQTVKLNP